MKRFYIRSNRTTVAGAAEIGGFIGELLVSSSAGPAFAPMSKMGRVRAAAVSQLIRRGIFEYDKKTKLIRLIRRDMWHADL